MTLTLTLTHHWFDQTESGAKRIEYRAMTPHWKRLIWDRRDRIKRVRFSRGYTKRTLTFAVSHIDIGPCPIEGWHGDFYRIHFTITDRPQTKYHCGDILHDERGSVSNGTRTTYVLLSRDPASWHKPPYNGTEPMTWRCAAFRLDKEGKVTSGTPVLELMEEDLDRLENWGPLQLRRKD